MLDSILCLEFPSVDLDGNSFQDFDYQFDRQLAQCSALSFDVQVVCQSSNKLGGRQGTIRHVEGVRVIPGCTAIKVLQAGVTSLAKRTKTAGSKFKKRW